MSHTDPAQRRRAFRPDEGQALLELALVLPVLLTCLLFGLVISELVRAKLKLLELSRGLAWELTAHPLSNYGVEPGSGSAEATLAAHARAFRLARGEALGALLARYDRLDALEPTLPFSPLVDLSPPAATLEELAPAVRPQPIGPFSLPGQLDGRPYLAASGRDLGAVLEAWGFNLRGAGQAEVRVQLKSRLLPEHLFQGLPGGPRANDSSGPPLPPLGLSARHALVADDWHSPDGLDSNMVPGRAGRHGLQEGGEDSLLYRQVGRMKFLGVSGDDPMAPLWAHGFGALSLLLRFPEVAFRGTFVVSHGYAGNERSSTRRGCEGPSGEVKHPAFAGMNNLDPRRSSGQYGPGAEPLRLTGAAELRCFDTTPFRDTQSYLGTAREDGSPWIRIFSHRGNHFMGCKNAMAEDVSHPVDSSTSDVATDGVDCE